MLEGDYIMRIVRQFSEMLAALLFGKKAAGETITFAVLDELSLSFTGLSLNLLRRLGAQQILGLFTVKGELNIEKVYVAARLLYALAETEGGSVREQLEPRAHALLSEVAEVYGGFLNEEHEALTARLDSGVSC